MDKKTQGKLWNEAMLLWLSGRIKTMNDLRVWLQDNDLIGSRLKCVAFIHYADQYDMDHFRICGHVLSAHLRKYLRMEDDEPT